MLQRPLPARYRNAIGAALIYQPSDFQRLVKSGIAGDARCNPGCGAVFEPIRDTNAHLKLRQELNGFV